MKKNKKLLFLSSLDISGNRACSDGVTKKILLEIKTFRELGYSVEYIVRIDGKVYLVKNDGQKTELTYYDGVFYKTMARVYKVLRGSYEAPNVIYVRYEGNSIEMWRFLAKMKRSHHNIKIIAELPTYMGKWEQGASAKSKLAFIIHRLTDVTYRMPIDYMVTFDNHNKIFG